MSLGTEHQYRFSWAWFVSDTPLTNFVYAGKIHTPMEYKGELASYDMRLR